jgi:hypothetical protein
VTQRHKDHAGHLDRVKRARDGKQVDPIAAYIGAPRPSPVMVWTPEQSSAFLAYGRRDRLFALYRLFGWVVGASYEAPVSRWARPWRKRSPPSSVQLL